MARLFSLQVEGPHARQIAYTGRKVREIMHRWDDLGTQSL
jgi:hypothetical protein